MPLDESTRPVWLPREGERVMRAYSPEIRFGRTGADAQTADRTTVTINTPQEDRHGTIIEAAGIDLDAYRQNPIVLFMHDAYNPLANDSVVKLAGKNLVAQVDDSNFDLEDPDVKKIHRRIKSGLIRMSSVGLAVMRTEKELRDPEGDPYDWRNIRVRIVESELREWSFVTIGSNRGALVTERMASDYFAPVSKPVIFPVSLEREAPEPESTPSDETPEETPASVDRVAPKNDPEQGPARPPRRNTITRAEAARLAASFGERIRLETKRSLGRA